MVGDDLLQVAKVGKADPSYDRQLRDQLADITRAHASTTSCRLTQVPHLESLRHALLVGARVFLQGWHFVT